MSYTKSCMISDGCDVCLMKEHICFSCFQNCYITYKIKMVSFKVHSWVITKSSNWFELIDMVNWTSDILDMDTFVLIV